MSWHKSRNLRSLLLSFSFSSNVKGMACSAEDIDELCNDLKTEVEHIAEWSRQNELRLNTEKTEYRVVDHKLQTNNIITPIVTSINGESIKGVIKVKYLGITMDENLTWNEHYKKLKCKIEAILRLSIN